jgi:thymidylate kinase
MNIIVFEGHDGVGKSTLINFISQKLESLGYSIYQLNNSKKNVLNLFEFDSPDYQNLIYQTRLSLLTSLITSLKIENEYEGIDLIFLHRYYYSTYVFASAMGVKLPNLTHLFPQPKLAFWIKCSEEERYKRILSRKGKKTSSDFQSMNRELISKADKIYSRFNLIEIFNEDLILSSKQVIDIILNNMN